MIDTPATRNVHRAQLLGMATAAQQCLDLDDPADFWYRQGVRDAYAFAAALLATGVVGDVTRAAADRVTDLLGEGITDLGVLMVATEPAPRPEPDGLTWVGPLAFGKLTADQPGIDHDLGSRWGTQRDVRISHRRPHDGTTGLLYAYDRTWDEYAILAHHIDTDTVETAKKAARAVDPDMPVEDFLDVLREARARPTPAAASLDTGPVLR